jgi:hypothetical protein
MDENSKHQKTQTQELFQKYSSTPTMKPTLNLFSHLQLLNRKCVKHSDAEWSEFCISKRLQNKKVNPGPVGSKRTQFCKFCGEQICMIRSDVYDK